MSIPLFSKNFWRYPKEVLSFLMEDPTSYWGSFNSVISRSIVHGVDRLFAGGNPLPIHPALRLGIGNLANREGSNWDRSGTCTQVRRQMRQQPNGALVT